MTVQRKLRQQACRDWAVCAATLWLHSVARDLPSPLSRALLPTPCQVYLNGERLKIKTFQEYVELYLGPKDPGPARVYERFSDRWEVCISTTEGQFNQVRWERAGRQFGRCTTQVLGWLAGGAAGNKVGQRCNS